MNPPEFLEPYDVAAYLSDSANRVVIARQPARARAGDPGATTPPRPNQYTIVELCFQWPNLYIVSRASKVLSCSTNLANACASYNAQLKPSD